MNIKSLIPWSRRNVPVMREQENPFYSLQRSINQVFDNFLDGFDFSPFGFESSMTSFRPRLDVSETDSDFRITVELPGMDEKDVEVSLVNNHLTLRGEKKAEKEDKQRDYYSLERSYGLFERTVPVPEGVDLDKVEASFRKGILTVTLPKSAEFQKERKRIPIKAA